MPDVVALTFVKFEQHPKTEHKYNTVEPRVSNLMCGGPRSDNRKVE